MNRSLKVVDSTADRPVFSDRGDSAVERQTPKTTRKRRPKNPAAARKPAPPPRRSAAEIESMTDEELLAEAGVEPIFSTTEAAEFFDKSNQWLYWGLREGVFTDDAGRPLDPERIGSAKHGRRRFTIGVLENIMRSSYRRGNIDPDQLKVIMRRIKYAQNGVDWREKEGWRYVHLGRSRYRWVHPDLCEWDEASREWRQVREWTFR